jgi:UDP-N-acetylmuramyl pentapeptide phosphotransferase/UDP-N-acetylglucosamine-1-phosphate transferase
MIDFITVLIIIFLASCLIKVIQSVFIKNNYIDKINHRSSHSVISTRSGGIAILVTLLITSTVFYINGFELYNYSLLIPIIILGVVGIYDDIHSVDFKLKFIFQVIAAKIIIDNGLIIDNFHGIFGLYEINRVLAQCVTILVICSIINAINFIDGIDGLAVSVIIFFIILFEFFAEIPTGFSNLSIIMVSSITPLLYYNYKKDFKVFLGDSGSLFLGGLVSVYVLKILSNDYIIKPEFDLNKILFVISILSYPIIDFTRVILIRIYNGTSPFMADKRHIHHLIQKKTTNHFKIVSIILIVQIVLILIIQGLFNFII